MKCRQKPREYDFFIYDKSEPDAARRWIESRNGFFFELINGECEFGPYEDNRGNMTARDGDTMLFDERMGLSLEKKEDFEKHFEVIETDPENEQKCIVSEPFVDGNPRVFYKKATFPKVEAERYTKGENGLAVIEWLAKNGQSFSIVHGEPVCIFSPGKMSQKITSGAVIVLSDDGGFEVTSEADFLNQYSTIKEA